jgi:pimeloyl-ACP methyl ester carboxylesterase
VFGLTSQGLFLALVTVAVLAPCSLVWLWLRRRTADIRRSRWGVAASVLSLTVLAQLSAVAATFVVVNRQFDFYSSWSDLFGQRSGDPGAISVNGSLPPGRGRLVVLPVDGRASHTQSEMLAWLPPQYGERAYRHHRFPVVLFLPGQPEQPAGVFRGFQLGAAARSAMSADHVAPFVLVIPPLMIRPPVDTECTDVPHGPRAETWLATDVPRAITAQLRVDPPGRHWSVLGWSTGAFCAAKLLYAHPQQFAAAVGLGGYYQPTTQKAWPNLFGGRPSFERHNSPQWLYAHRSSGLTGRLLIVTSRQDRESWVSSAKMLRATQDNPNVSRVVLPHGGHNFGVYRPTIGTSLRWLAGTGVLT